MSNQRAAQVRFRKAHVIERRWSVGGFHTIRKVLCRCGWQAEHYNAGALTALFKAHQAEMEAAPSSEAESSGGDQ